MGDQEREEERRMTSFGTDFQVVIYALCCSKFYLNLTVHASIINFMKTP